MRKAVSSISTFLLLQTIIAQAQDVAPPPPPQVFYGYSGDLVPSISQPAHINRYWNALEALIHRSPLVQRGRGIGPQSESIVTEIDSLLTPLFENQDLLVKTVADTLGQDSATVKFIPSNRWAELSRTGDGRQRFVTISPGGGHRGSMVYFNSAGVLFKLQFAPSISNRDAQTILDKYKAVLAGDVRKITDRVFNERYDLALDSATKATAETEAKLHELEAEKRKLQSRLLAEMPQSNASDYLTTIALQQFDAKLTLVGIEARRKSVAEQIDLLKGDHEEKGTAQAKHQAQIELELLKAKLLVVRESRLDSLKKQLEAGAQGISSGDISEAEAKLLETKIQLAEVDARKRTTASNPHLTALRTELATLNVNFEEATARYQHLTDANNKAGEKISRRVELDREMTRLDGNLKQAESKFNAAQQRVAELKEIKAHFEPIDLTKSDGPLR